MPGAAFFDLDRTILLDASGPELTLALVEAGIAPDHNIPGMGVMGEVYRRFGETLPVMALARAAALAAKGWSVAAVDEVAALAGKALERKVAPYARPLLAQHHAE